MYNLIYADVKLNKKPLTLSQAQTEVSSIIMNYGYRPEIVYINDNPIAVGDRFQSSTGYQIYEAIKINDKTINATYEGCPFQYVRIPKSKCTLWRKAVK